MKNDIPAICGTLTHEGKSYSYKIELSPEALENSDSPIHSFSVETDNFTFEWNYKTRGLKEELIKALERRKDMPGWVRA